MVCTISLTTKCDGDQTYMRLGFKGETQVNDQLTGYGQWEYQIQGNTLKATTRPGLVWRSRV
jgi:predicted porin